MNNKIVKRIKRKLRIRAKVNGTALRPRLSVYRSNKSLYAQLVDDDAKVTLGSSKVKGTTVAQAKVLGAEITVLAKKLSVKAVVFDRGGYQYHGVIKAIAEAVREGGLQV
jgi:large subunit ribosomal protein L18